MCVELALRFVTQLQRNSVSSAFGHPAQVDTSSSQVICCYTNDIPLKRIVLCDLRVCLATLCKSVRKFRFSKLTLSCVDLHPFVLVSAKKRQTAGPVEVRAKSICEKGQARRTGSEKSPELTRLYVLSYTIDWVQLKQQSLHNRKKRTILVILLLNFFVP